MNTKPTTEAVEAIFGAFKKAEQWCSNEMRAYKLEEYLRDEGFTITRAEPAMTTRRFEMNATVKLLNKYEISYTTDENGKITVGGSLDLRGLTSIPEGFNPTVGDSIYLSGLTSIPEGFNPTVGGSLYLRGLTSIPEGFNPTVGGSLYLSGLTSIPEGFNPTVGGSLYLRGLTSIPEGFNPTVGGSLDLRGLTSIPEGFNPTVGGSLYLSGLTSIPEGFNPTVGGSLYLSGLTSIPEGFNPTVGGSIYLSGLTSIPEGFNPTVGDSLDLRGLTSIPEGFNPTVGGYLYLSGLTSIPEGFNPTVGGSIYLSGLTSIPEGFNPTVGDSLYLSVKLKEKTKPLPEDFRFQLSLKIEAKFNLRGFTFADNILARILSKRGNAKKVQVVGKKESSWLVSDGEGNNAHGDTLKKATEELRFKTASRDVEQFRGMNKGTRKTPQEWAFVYRAITGACQSGTAHFMGKHTLKKTYTLQEIIDQTRGAFGHERFVEVTK